MDEEIRRIFRQHLAKWSNKMVQIVGLERVAEELMGRTKWGIKPEMSMMVGQDWRPSSDAAPSPAPLTPPASCQTTSTTASITQWSVVHPFRSIVNKEKSLLHRCPTNVDTPKILHKCSCKVGSGGGGLGGIWEGDCSSSGSSSPGTIPAWFIRPPESPPDQPLDLSAKSRQDSNSPGPSSQPSPSPSLKLPALPRHIFKAKPRLSAVPGRRTYTEDELQAALRDIQSGKLGTRRAAVIYGIPRSTLRNKVYKLSQERRDKEEEEEEEEEDDEEKEVLGELRKPLLSVEDVVRLAGDNALPYLNRIVRDRENMPEAVRSMIAEEKRLEAERRPEDLLRVPSLRGSPPSSPVLPRPQPAPTLNNNDEKKPSTSKMTANQAAAAAAAGGKGTRPKRGKYRNYDRDSLVEAVRAVQRGEMSVHRAGSYYGVPHSTLEYKVKERHLMRPRKREPKLQNSLQEEIKRKEEADKRAAAQMAARRSRFPPPTNGLKLGLLDPAMYQSWPVWPPHWTALETAYTRPDLFGQQALYRLAEEQAAASTSAAAAAADVAGLTKAARRVAEQLYDGTGENGSFLDGIIRSSLEETPSETNKQPLMEHLVKAQPIASPAASPQPPSPASSACDNNNKPS